MNNNNSNKSVRTTPKLMGIVNVTPDSFSDGGQFSGVSDAIEHGLRLAGEGADILDIGGESTRPGADDVSVDDELARVMPVIEGLAARTPTPISIDTRKPQIAIAAINAGATIWNDVSALTFSPDGLAVAARLDCQIVLMHAQGSPQTMQNNPTYQDVVRDVAEWLQARVRSCELAGIDQGRLIIDPGLGFGKTLAHNLSLLRGLDQLAMLGLPVLIGASRKRFIAMLDRGNTTNDRLGGSIAVALYAAQHGATILRVHDVAQTRQALNVGLVLGSNPT